MRFVIIGGSDAGISAALRARELDSSAHITVILADAFPNYSICGLPFYLSGETADWRQLAHRTEFEGIDLLTNHTAQGFDPAGRRVTATNAAGSKKTISYDALLIATGAHPVIPRIPGIDSPGVFPLHTMENSFRIRRYLDERAPQSAVIVGSGYIGLEMADALTHRGVKVTLIGRSKTVLHTVNANFGRVIEDVLRSHGVRVESDCEVRSIVEDRGQLGVYGSREVNVAAELVLVAAGVRPSAAIGEHAGLRTGIKGALCVNSRTETDIAGIFAAGDCVETCEFQGSLGTQVVKVFDLAIARTGLSDEEARKAGFRPFTVESRHSDHKAYYPGAQQLCVSLTGDRISGKILGAQMLGHWQSQVAKRIDVYATALFHDMDVEGVNDLYLSYTPPFSSPWDPVQMAAQAWSRAAA